MKERTGKREEGDGGTSGKRGKKKIIKEWFWYYWRCFSFVPSCFRYPLQSLIGGFLIVGLYGSQCGG